MSAFGVLGFQLLLMKEEKLLIWIGFHLFMLHILWTARVGHTKVYKLEYVYSLQILPAKAKKLVVMCLNYRH